MNLQERAMPNAFAGKRDFAPETKAPEHPHKSDCRFAETVCPRKTPPNRAYLREFSASATCRRCNLQSECLPETFFVSARRDYEPETRTSIADMPPITLEQGSALF
jgi:hypothetical protein